VAHNKLHQNNQILTPYVYIKHDYTVLSDYTTLICDIQVKLNGEEIKFDQIKIWVLFECKWNRDRMISVPNCVLRKIFERRKREAEG
jgi:hypothetical protein